MWICLNNAFVSIVAPESGSDNLLVRARRPSDIEAVFGKDYKVEKRPERDYLFRALIPREVVADVIAAQVMDIDYGNFKNSVNNRRLHDAYARVWSVMAGLQSTPPYSGVRARRQAELL